MRKRRPAKREPKSDQVHFWVAPELLREFDATARRLGEKNTDAHRLAMRSWVDSNADEGASFLFDATFTIAGKKVHVSFFERDDRELLLRLTGPAAQQLVSAASLLKRRGGVGDGLAATFARLLGS